jgi:hypothetical protein
MTTLAPPKPQHLRALEIANRLRFGMADFKREARSLSRREGFGLLAAHLEAREMLDEIGAFKLDAFLTCPVRVGPNKAGEVIRAAGLSPKRTTKRVRDLTLSERSRLAAILRGMGER